MKPKMGRMQAMALVMSVGGLWLLPLSLLSAQEPKLRDTLKGHTEAVWSVAFSPSGKTLASGGGFAGSPGDIHLWDVATGKEQDTLKGHPNGVNCVAFSPDGKTLASSSGSFGGTIKLWDVATGKERAALAK